MRTDYLQQAFEPTESPGLETFDSRLDEISTAMLDGKYDDAVGPVEAVFEDGICDVRVVGFYAYLVFHQHGVGSLAQVFSDLAAVLGANWPAVGPLKNREKVTQNSFNWFYKHLVRRFQREESSQGPGWRAWVDGVTAEEVEQIVEAADELRRGLIATLEDLSGPVLDLHGKSREWLESFERVVYREPEPEEEEEPEPEPGEEPEDEPPASREAPRSPAGGTMAEGSVHLQLLQRKMKAFERLIDNEKYARAALVADDINQTIAEFDPLRFFPQLFARYVRVHAVSIGELTEYDDAKDSRDWQALQAFYATDLEGFVDE